jgi:hypothetical protein
MGVRDIIFFLARRPQAIKILRVAAEYKKVKGKGPYTRELLRLAANGDRGYSMQLIEELHELGLLHRYEDYLDDKVRIPVVRNEPTPLAYKVLEFIDGDEDA